MSWLKMGRWLLVGVMAASGAAACGGRGNLPTGEASAGETSGGHTFGGAISFGGSSAGTLAAGGVVTFGGSFPAAGTASAGGPSEICLPGLSTCEGNAIAICTGTTLTLKDCGPNQTCIERGNTPSCVPIVCKPGQVLCDATGKFVQVCSANGTSKVNRVNCGAQGQYCDPLVLSCQNGICSPNQPACNGNVATTCNANGSGYLGLGVDCASVPGRQCVQGACLCAANLADCDGLAKTGCEAKITTDPDNCSGCGLACSANHVAKRTCNGGCDGTCSAGFQDCNGDKLSDGCETGIASDVENCGGCNLACSNNHVTASCDSGVCDGTCLVNFADCNGNKLKDGCESDARVDPKNCGGCGVVCSTNHIKRACAAAVCSGTCVAGFDDCNANKQADGCEINTQTDAKNCGSCGKVCADGSSCSGGKCSSVVTFSGVAEDVSIASLTGWSQCYAETYGQGSTSIRSIEAACTGSLLMMACRAAGADTLQLAAYAPRADVLFDTGIGNLPHDANGVGWYFNGSQSWGFAPAGDAIVRNSCDTQDSAIDATGVDGNLRLCWHTGGDIIQGGWRCGRNDGLNADTTYERLLFQAP